MKKLISFVLAVMFLFIAASTLTAKDYNPSRVGLIVHTKIAIKPGLDLTHHFVVSPNLTNGVNPIAEFGVVFKPTSWLSTEPIMAYEFKTDRLITSLRNTISYSENAYTWIRADLKPQNKDGYWRIQNEYKISPTIHVGCEGEGWGNYKGQLINGGGPNILLKFGGVSVDTALHFRNITGSIKKELVMRVNLNL